MKILDQNYYYLTNTFKGENGVWRLSGTQSTTHYAKNAIDTFKNIKTGEFIEVERCKVMDMQTKGLIKPL